MRTEFVNYKIILVIVILFISLFFIEKRTNFFMRAYDSLILDNKNHYLDCDQLPSIDTVDKIMSEHKKEIEEIKNIAHGQISVEKGAGNNNCQGKTDIIIYYGSREQRNKIEKIIGNNFFGIPYRLMNI